MQFKINNKRFLAVTEIEVLDAINFAPYEWRIALPDENPTSCARCFKFKTNSRNRRFTRAKCKLRNICRTRLTERQRCQSLNGEPVLEPPALHSLGAYWIISGDDNQNAQVEFAIRKSGAAQWQNVMPLRRVMKGDHKNEAGQSKLEVPNDAWLFAGSALQLQPDTDYEINLKLLDPDGGNVEKTLAKSHARRAESRCQRATISCGFRQRRRRWQQRKSVQRLGRGAGKSQSGRCVFVARGHL